MMMEDKGDLALPDSTGMTIKNDSCHPDDPGQFYIDCPNCAAGRITS